MKLNYGIQQWIIRRMFSKSMDVVFIKILTCFHTPTRTMALVNCTSGICPQISTRMKFCSTLIALEPSINSDCWWTMTITIVAIATWNFITSKVLLSLWMWWIIIDQLQALNLTSRNHMKSVPCMRSTCQSFQLKSSKMNSPNCSLTLAILKLRCQQQSPTTSRTVLAQYSFNFPITRPPWEPNNMVILLRNCKTNETYNNLLLLQAPLAPSTFGDVQSRFCGPRLKPITHSSTIHIKVSSSGIFQNQWQLTRCVAFFVNWFSIMKFCASSHKMINGWSSSQTSNQRSV